MTNVTQEKTKFNPAEHLISLKGGEYLEVKWRLVWFREDHPLWTIETDALDVSKDGAFFKAYIHDENGFVLATGHGSETPRDFKDFVEKAETKAIGRALCFLGYGTQFAPELEEGNRIVDAPVKRNDVMFRCEKCGEVLKPYEHNGKQVGLREHAAASKEKFGRVLCLECIKEENDAERC